MYFKVTKCLPLLYCAFLSSSLMAKDAKTNTPSEGLQKPLCFVENKGQVMDEANNPRNDIQFKLATPGMSLFIGNGQLHYQYKKVESDGSGDPKVSACRMDVTLLGADPAAEFVATERQGYYENYYLAQTGASGFTVHSWDRITYRNVYPNIDWVLYVTNNKVEYDFVVRPGGNVQDIKLQYDGATQLSLTKEGGLMAHTSMGDIEAKKPYSYETSTGKAVASDFVLKDNILTFNAGSYRGSLTIDPYLLWSTYYGGSGEDVVTSIKETTGGSTFVGGYTASNNLLTSGGGAVRGAFVGGYDAFFAKYTAATGGITYATYFGGFGNDYGTSIAIDNTGANPNVYLAGYSNSFFFLKNSGAPYATTVGYHALNDGFLLKMTNGGGFTWCTYFGGSNDDYIYGVTCDAANNVYITGQTASPTGIASSATVYQPSLSGGTDAFVAKLSSAGAVAWSTYFGGSAQEKGTGIVCDPSGNVYVTGQTNSIVAIASASAFQSSLNGVNDAFIAEFSTTGTRTWGTYYGGPGSEQGNGIAYDPISGNIAIVGNTSSTSGIATANAFQQVYGGGTQDAFLSYFTTAGSQIWGTYLGGSAPDYGQAVCFDPMGNIIMAGGTFSTSGVASAVGTFGPTAFQNAIGGDYDAYITKVSPLGQNLWSTYFGGAFYDYANSVSCNSAYQITIGGYTSSTGLYYAGGIAAAGASQVANAGGTYDGFISKFKADTLSTVTQPYYDTLVCAGGSLNISYTSNFAHPAGNIFSVQMSDITGSFAAATTIGSLTSTASTGIIACVVPAATAAGTGYRIRITSSLPVYTSPDDNVNIHVVTLLPNTTAAGTTPSCVGNSIYFNDISSYSVSNYYWWGPNGFTAVTRNPTLFPAALASAGVYSVSTTHNGCPSDTATVTIAVNNNYPPLPSDSVSSPNCAGKTIYFFGRPDTTATGITYSWSGPAGFVSTVQNPSISLASAANSGRYILADTLAGCPSGTVAVTVTVSPTTPVAVSISANPGDTICSGTSVTFTAIPVNGGSTPHYQWMSGVLTPIVGAYSNTFTSSTLVNGETIFCELTSAVLCPIPAVANSNTIKMDVIDVPPIVQIYASTGNIVPPGTTINFTSAVYEAGPTPIYQWKHNGKNIAGANTSSLTYTTSSKNDTICLMVTSILNCAVPNYDVSCLNIIPTTAVGNVATPFDDVSLFPNPNGGNFTISGSLQNIATDKISFEIINPLGQLVVSGHAAVQNSTIDKSIDLTNVPDGVYLMRIHDELDSKVIRFAVQH